MLKTGKLVEDTLFRYGKRLAYEQQVLSVWFRSTKGQEMICVVLLSFLVSYFYSPIHSFVIDVDEEIKHLFTDEERNQITYDRLEVRSTSQKSLLGTSRSVEFCKREAGNSDY